MFHKESHVDSSPLDFYIPAALYLQVLSSSDIYRGHNFIIYRRPKQHFSSIICVGVTTAA